MSKSVNLGVKSAIARLLATENIQVNQTNSKTAWFDVEKRVLNLPLWDVELFVYDMLVGHEVGHALYTPAAGWHQSIEDLGIPRSYINVVEDARIEKLIKHKYPGLVFTFNRAYNWMAEQDFFQIKHRSLYKMKLIDRINVHFKLGSSIKVPFAESELVFIDKINRCETFDEVVEICKEILAHWKENKEDIQEELQNVLDMMQDMSDDEDFDHDFDNIDSGDDSGDEYEETDAEDGDDDADSDEIGDETEEKSNVTGAGRYDDDDDEDSSKEEDPEEADTDNAMRRAEQKMLSSESGEIMKPFPESLAMEAMVPYKTYYAAKREWYLRNAFQVGGFNRYEHDDPVTAFSDHCNILFKKFMTDTNRVVSYMAKEFEQKKAAYQYSRAKVSTSGTLNTTTLHKYKFSEDVFKRVTTLANAKSHGMVISIDFSGSMSNVLLDTIKQALNLALFCRRVNIPFEMYAFTCGRKIDNPQIEIDSKLLTGMINPGTFHYLQLFSHKMKKREFDNAVKEVFMVACGKQSEYDHLGSTPTNEMLISLKYLLKKFRKETGVQKLMNIILTDGEPNRSHIYTGDDYNMSAYRRNYNMLEVSPTKVIKVYNTSNDLSQALLKNIAQECDATNFGYFLGDNSALKNVMYRLTAGSYNETQKIKSTMRKEGGASADNVMGYDRYVLIKSNSFDIQEGDFEVAEDAKKSTIAREFAKYAKGRRTSRVLLDRFVQAIA